MRRVLVPTAIAAALLAVALLGTSCGVAADDRAAVVGNRTITTDTTDQLARDRVFVQSVVNGQLPPDDESRLPGDVARSTLEFQIQVAALQQEAERLGIDLAGLDRAAARKLVLGQVQGRPSATTTDVLVDFVVARQALTERLAKVDPQSQKDLQLLYDGAPALWNRVCVTVVGVPVASAERAARLLSRGTGLLELGNRVEGAQALASPSKGCIVLAQLPPELREAMDGAKVGRRVGPVVVSSAQGDTAYFFRISERQVVSFGEASGDIAQIAGSLQQSPQRVVLQWIGLTVLDRVAVNPRYGRVAANVNGGITVVPPSTPLVPLSSIRLPSAGPAAGGAGAADPGAAGSGAAGSGAAGSGAGSGSSADGSTPASGAGGAGTSADTPAASSATP
ncbi:MAG: hypothetical protein ACOYOP_14440 [Microthrixaceae bacterium]